MSKRGVQIFIQAVAFALAGPSLWAAQQPSQAAAKALQRLAEKQGHPVAAVKALKNLGYRVPPEIEAEAAGVKPDAVRKAIENGGSLASRLETARGRPLSSDQLERIGEAEREHARQLQPLRQKFVQDASRILGLPEAKVRKVLGRDTLTPAAATRCIAQFERLLGRRLSAGDVARLAAARDEFRAAAQAQRKSLAQQVAKIAAMPQSVVLELLP